MCFALKLSNEITATPLAIIDSAIAKPHLPLTALQSFGEVAVIGPVHRTAPLAVTLDQAVDPLGGIKGIPLVPALIALLSFK